MPVSDIQTHKDQLLEGTLKSSVQLCFRHWRLLAIITAIPAHA